MYVPDIGSPLLLVEKLESIREEKAERCLWGDQTTDLAIRTGSAVINIRSMSSASSKLRGSVLHGKSKSCSTGRVCSQN